MPLVLAESLGRRLMMDFGFGAFLEKIEQHFGKRALKVLLMLIGLAVALVCAQIIWKIALGPAVAFLIRSVDIAGVGKTLALVAWFGMAWVAGSAVSAAIVASFVRWREARAYREATSRLEALRAEQTAWFRQNEAEIEQRLKDAKRVLEEAKVESVAFHELKASVEAALANRNGHSIGSLPPSA